MHAAMSCDLEGNRRSGVALAMRHRLKWFIHIRAKGLSKGDEHSTNTLHGVCYSLPFTFTYLYGAVLRTSAASGIMRRRHVEPNEDVQFRALCSQERLNVYTTVV